MIKEILCKKCNSVLTEKDYLHAKMCVYCYNKESKERMKKKKPKKRSKSKKQIVKDILRYHQNISNYIYKGKKNNYYVKNSIEKINKIENLENIIDELFSIGELEFFHLENGKIIIDEVFLNRIDLFGFDFAYNQKYETIKTHNLSELFNIYLTN